MANSKGYIVLIIVLTLFLMLFVCFPEAAVNAAEVSFMSLDFNGGSETGDIPKPWNIRLREGKADVKVVSEGGNVLHVKCSQSSFAVERNVSVDLDKSSHISWTWKALRLPSQGDVRKKGRNDQALQILVAFKNGKILSYVWDTNAPEGTITDESVGWPINLKIKVIVVQSGTLDIGKWITHTRNIYEDYLNLFHEEPASVKGVRIQTNTQYTRDIAEGFIKNIQFGKALSMASEMHAAHSRTGTYAEKLSPKQ
ncbi:MAG TPA: hypothetical protein DCP92_16750 [Nitrospiraceae bacterium]|nr:hypothetical protein [Nitrospiraceae bacterium]